MSLNQVQVAGQGAVEKKQQAGVVICGIQYSSNGLFLLGDLFYQRITLLGTGGYGKVHLVEQKTGVEAGQRFAMKVVDKRKLSVNGKMRAELECLILKSCRHPFVLRLCHSFNFANAYVSVLQYFEGGDLFSRYQQICRFDHDEAVFYLGEITLGLEFLHHKGIIHRDLKMENILLGADGHIAIADFGLSAVLAPGQNEYEHDGKLGTARFMAPEMILGNNYTFAIDVWAFGVMAYEMLTGELPFNGELTCELENEIMFKHLEQPCGFRRYGWDFILKTLNKNPSCRPSFVNGTPGIGIIRYDPFFADFDFLQGINRTLRPPYIPTFGEET